MEKSKVKQIREDMNKALAEIEKTHGVNFDIGTIRFDKDGFRATIEAIETNNPNDQEAIDRAKFEKEIKRLFWLEKNDFHREFTFHGDSYKVVGANARAKKYPIIGENGNGTRYKFPASVIK